jgi:hypothetical protein
MFNIYLINELATLPALFAMTEWQNLADNRRRIAGMHFPPIIAITTFSFKNFLLLMKLLISKYSLLIKRSFCFYLLLVHDDTLCL